MYSTFLWVTFAKLRCCYFWVAVNLMFIAKLQKKNKIYYNTAVSSASPSSEKRANHSATSSHHRIGSSAGHKNGKGRDHRTGSGEKDHKSEVCNFHSIHFLQDVYFYQKVHCAATFESRQDQTIWRLTWDCQDFI